MGNRWEGGEMGNLVEWVKLAEKSTFAACVCVCGGYVRNVRNV